MTTTTCLSLLAHHTLDVFRLGSRSRDRRFSTAPSNVSRAREIFLVRFLVTLLRLADGAITRRSVKLGRRFQPHVPSPHPRNLHERARFSALHPALSASFRRISSRCIVPIVRIFSPHVPLVHELVCHVTVCVREHGARIPPEPLDPSHRLSAVPRHRVLHDRRLRPLHHHLALVRPAPILRAVGVFVLVVLRRRGTGSASGA